MSTEWFYQVMDEVVGPLSPGELLEHVRTGQIKVDTPIRKDDSQWVPADEVNGLFTAAERKPTERICPYCGHKVDKPPTMCGGCGRRLVLSFSMSEDANNHKAKKKEPAAEKEASTAVSPEEQVDRQYILKYTGMLLLLFSLLVVAPILIYLASSGRLIFRNDWTTVSVVIVASAIGLIYYWMLTTD